MRIDQAVTDARLRTALVNAMFRVASELRAWRSQRESAGASALDAIEGPRFGGETEATSCWRQAVSGYAAADLADTHGDISATEAGRDRNAVRAVSADEHRRNAVRAIRLLRGSRAARLA